MDPEEALPPIDVGDPHQPDIARSQPEARQKQDDGPIPDAGRGVSPAGSDDPLDHCLIGIARKGGQSVRHHGRNDMLQFRAAAAIGRLKLKEAAQDCRCLADHRAGKIRRLLEDDLPKDGNIIGGRIGPKRWQKPSGNEDVVLDRPFRRAAMVTKPVAKGLSSRVAARLQGKRRNNAAFLQEFESARRTGARE